MRFQNLALPPRGFTVSDTEDCQSEQYGPGLVVGPYKATDWDACAYQQTSLGCKFASSDRLKTVRYAHTQAQTAWFLNSGLPSKPWNTAVSSQQRVGVGVCPYLPFPVK